MPSVVGNRRAMTSRTLAGFLANVAISMERESSTLAQATPTCFESGCHREGSTLKVRWKNPQLDTHRGLPNFARPQPPTFGTCSQLIDPEAGCERDNPGVLKLR